MPFIHIYFETPPRLLTPEFINYHITFLRRVLISVRNFMFLSQMCSVTMNHQLIYWTILAPFAENTVRTYIGCFADPSQNDLEYLAWRGQATTTWMCVQECHRLKYRYAGTQVCFSAAIAYFLAQPRIYWQVRNSATNSHQSAMKHPPRVYPVGHVPNFYRTILYPRGNFSQYWKVHRQILIRHLMWSFILKWGPMLQRE